jgi:hypothetical protein
MQFLLLLIIYRRLRPQKRFMHQKQPQMIVKRKDNLFCNYLPETCARLEHLQTNIHIIFCMHIVD